MYKWLGFIMVGLAALGVVLPLLPTTPFLLVGAACFARSSPKWHQWLLNHRWFGAFIHNWQVHQCIHLKTKLVALASIIGFGGYSVFFAINNIYLQVVGGALLLIGLVSVLRIKLC
jgi:uncharacterized membrane protein YbaN (DUF454 family)